MLSRQLLQRWRARLHRMQGRWVHSKHGRITIHPFCAATANLCRARPNPRTHQVCRLAADHEKQDSNAAWKACQPGRAVGLSTQGTPWYIAVVQVHAANDVVFEDIAAGFSQLCSSLLPSLELQLVRTGSLAHEGLQFRWVQLQPACCRHAPGPSKGDQCQLAQGKQIELSLLLSQPKPIVCAIGLTPCISW